MKKDFLFKNYHLLILVTALILPIWVTPWFEQIFYTSKILLSIVVAILVSLAWITNIWQKKVLHLAWSKLSLLLVSWLGIILASTFLSNKYPVENLMGMGGVYISGLVTALLGSTLLKNLNLKKVGHSFLTFLSISSVVLFITQVLQIFGVGPSVILNKLGAGNLPHNAVVNLAGSNLIAFQVLSITLVGWMSKLLSEVKKGQLKTQTLGFTGTLVAAIVLTLWTMLPGKITQPIILPYAATWNITIDSIKDVKTLLVGVGPENFINAFNQHKPDWINTHKYGAIQFTQGSITPLSLLTTTGIFSTIVWILLIIFLLKEFKTHKTKPVYWMLLTSFAFELLLPLNIVVFMLQMLMLAVLIAQSKNTTIIKLEKIPARISQILGLALLLVVIVTTYLVGVGFYAAHLQHKSQLALQTNQAVAAYQLQQKSVQLNPYSDLAHRKYSLINLSLASALSQKANMTESERAQFAQLVQQSIREAKAATVVDDKDTRNWQILAEVYQTLDTVAQDAEQWAVKSFVEAIKTSPADPNLRIRLGGVFYNQGEYESALKFFEQAVNLKADSANAYYNAANTLVKMNRLQDAQLAYQKTLLLVNPESPDYQTASQELNQIEQTLQNQPLDNTAQPAQEASSPGSTSPEQNSEQPPAPPAVEVETE
jgi:tetratricopeptide (TPR) repeat protein/uncharacterized membrane protein YeaQ/YmgE (transglycosylase-associated protein family)